MEKKYCLPSGEKRSEMIGRRSEHPLKKQERVWEGKENDESGHRNKNTFDWFVCGEPDTADDCLSGGQKPSGPAEL